MPPVRGFIEVFFYRFSDFFFPPFCNCLWGAGNFFFFQGCINLGVVEVQVCVDGTKVRNH